MKPIQPIFILPEGTERSSGKNAQKNNVLAAKELADSIRTTLGPKGMDKMIVGNDEVIITNDGVSILKAMPITNPIAKLIVDIAITQEKEVGDGTTTVVILAGELLSKAESLIEQNIHPTVITKGFRIAKEKALELLDKLSYEIKIEDKDKIKSLAITAMTGKGTDNAKNRLSELILRALEITGENFNRNNIIIKTLTEGSVNDSELIKGVIIDREKLHPSMPSIIKNAKIAILNTPIEIRTPDSSRNISINSPQELQAFLNQEEEMLKEQVEIIKRSGANLVLCQKGIDELAQYFLAKNNILTFRRIPKSELNEISKATGATIVNNLKDLSQKNLGFAEVVKEVKVSDKNLYFITGCKDPKAITIVIRGSTEQITNEIKRAVEDAIGDIEAALKYKKILSGAGAVEIELSKELKKFAETIRGKEQLAVSAFAEALEVIPKTLAENSGLDTIEVLSELKSLHEKGKKDYGILEKVDNAFRRGVVEPYKIKAQAIISATEVSEMILRIDDVIRSNIKQENKSLDF